jgi:hypothetical protein
MKRFISLFAVAIIFTAATYAQSSFDTYFFDKTLRFDYQRAGDTAKEVIYFDEMIEEPIWGGSKTNLIDNFEMGRYYVELRDSATNTLIFSKNYSTLFSEWLTTAESKKIKRSFPEVVTFPYPKNACVLTFFARDRKNKLEKQSAFNIDPNNYFIKKDRRLVYPNFKVSYSGEPSQKVDIVIIPEGYTKDQMELFKKDCQKFAGYLFNSSPYKENKDKFNIWGIEAPSPDSGTDIPGERIYRNTLANTTFYTFDLERYCMTTDYKSVRDLAANAPYDQIYILVNSSKYGGGAIFNFYSICVHDNKHEEYIFVHEFGHGFASLADEYYESTTAYEDFYPKDVEPSDPNLTTLVDFSKKWKDLVEPGTPIPTPATPEYKDKVGAFEGGGYVDKGIYRPMQDCTMKSISVNNFCPVCKRSIIKMIDYYTK